MPDANYVVTLISKPTAITAALLGSGAVSPIAVEMSGTRGPKGDSASQFTYQQTVPGNVWTVNHGLGRIASVTVVDSSGSEVHGDVQYPDLNTIILTFSAAFAGTAYVI